MKRPVEIEEQIWRYIDGSCSGADKITIAAKIAEDKTWRAKFNELQQLNTGLKGLEPDLPLPGFSMRVMNALKSEPAHQPAKKYINKYIIGGISCFFLLIIFIGIYQAVYSEADKQGASLFESTQPGLNYSYLFSRNIILLIVAINITLALALADKILRKRIYF